MPCHHYETRTERNMCDLSKRMLAAFQRGRRGACVSSHSKHLTNVLQKSLLVRKAQSHTQNLTPTFVRLKNSSWGCIGGKGQDHVSLALDPMNTVCGSTLITASSCESFVGYHEINDSGYLSPVGRIQGRPLKGSDD